jgi:hypothetical protein
MRSAWLALLFAAALPARAEPRRMALLVGANQGALGRASLRYSYGDAEQMAAVLTQAGQFAESDVRLLRDPEPQAVLDELDRDLSLLQQAGGESLLLFYYSGHADTVALYPKGQPLPFAQLRQRLESQSATVRIGIIDACAGGGWTGAKGLQPSAPFVVEVPLALTGEGSVLIASSSGVEKAHESEQINGSFFTHHLVAGLRGAASQRGDGVVTLTDAFAYARERTIRDSAAVADPQHPSFSMNLRGRGDLPLTRLAQTRSLVQLNEIEGPLQLIHLGTGLVVLEVPGGKREVKLTVPPGRYLVRRQQSTGNYSREVTVDPDQPVSVDEGQLQLSPFPHEGSKVFESGTAGWPLALNDRPLTLLAGMAEVRLGALAEADSTAPIFTSTRPADPGGGVDTRFRATRIGSPTAFDGTLRYGLTGRLTLSLGGTGATDRDCIQAFACHPIDSGVRAGGLFLVTPGPIEVLANAGVVSSGTRPASFGLTARAGGGQIVSFQLTADLVVNLRRPAVVVAPGNPYVNQPVHGTSVALAGLVTVQALERLAFDAGAQWNPYQDNPYTGTFEIPLTAGATVTLSHHFDLRAQVLFADILPAAGLAAGDEKQLGLFLAVRP